MRPRCSDIRERLYPIMRELPADVETPISIYLKLRGLGPSFLLESVEGGEHLARYSFIGMQPRAILRAWRGRAVYEAEGQWQELSLGGGDVLDVLRQRLPRYEDPPAGGLPRFTGGAVGYMGYDLVRSFERLPAHAPDTLALPEAIFLLCDRLVIYDHVKHRLLVIAHAPTRTQAPWGTHEAQAALDEIAARLRRPLPPGAAPARQRRPLPNRNLSPPPLPAPSTRMPCARPRNISPRATSFRWCSLAASSGARTPSPSTSIAPCGASIPPPTCSTCELPDGLRLIGSSPEVLVRLEGDVVETRPLAGTRPRGATPEEDRALAEELLADPKERAEHVMLVDLARNDLGRVCRYRHGATPATDGDRALLPRHAHRLQRAAASWRPGATPSTSCAPAFPAGTVSGAPKVRAMQIIDELEPERRGPYAGAVGYFGFSGNMDTCIAIRTIVMQGDRVYLQAGAGIVADSDPAREYEETDNKLRALCRRRCIWPNVAIGQAI